MVRSPSYLYPNLERKKRKEKRGHILICKAILKKLESTTPHMYVINMSYELVVYKFVVQVNICKIQTLQMYITYLFGANYHMIYSRDFYNAKCKWPKT